MGGGGLFAALALGYCYRYMYIYPLCVTLKSAITICLFFHITLFGYRMGMSGCEYV
jgi:hypothetical protein